MFRKPRAWSRWKERMDTGKEGASPPLSGMNQEPPANINNPITYLSKSMSILGDSTTHTPREGIAGLIDLVHPAIVEGHAPRVSGDIRDRSSRPVLGRHHI